VHLLNAFPLLQSPYAVKIKLCSLIIARFFTYQGEVLF